MFINCTTVYIRTSPAIFLGAVSGSLFFSVVLVCRVLLSVIVCWLGSSFDFFSVGRCVVKKANVLPYALLILIATCRCVGYIFQSAISF